MIGKAVLVKDNLPRFAGHAALYRLDPPLQDYDWDDLPTDKHEFVVVSAAEVMFSGPETLILPATPDGKVSDWGELPGSGKGTLSHETALSKAGYAVATS